MGHTGRRHLPAVCNPHLGGLRYGEIQTGKDCTEVATKMWAKTTWNRALVRLPESVPQLELCPFYSYTHVPWSFLFYGHSNCIHYNPQGTTSLGQKAIWTNHYLTLLTVNVPSKPKALSLPPAHNPAGTGHLGPVFPSNILCLDTPWLTMEMHPDKAIASRNTRRWWVNLQYLTFWTLSLLRPMYLPYAKTLTLA